MVKPTTVQTPSIRKNLFALSSAKIFLLPALRSIGAGPVYPAIVPAGAPTGSLGGARGLGEEAKPVPPP